MNDNIYNILNDFYKSCSIGDIKKVKKYFKKVANILRDTMENNKGHLKINSINNSLNDFALRIAATNGHLEVVKFLIENGANVHANDDCALCWAAKNGHLEVVKFLEKHVKSKKKS